MNDEANQMSDNLGYYVAPGVIRLTPAAHARASAFVKHMGAARGGGWIVSFDWGSERTLVNRSLGTSRDLGPGLDICAARPGEVPEAAVCDDGGLRFALQIPQDVVANAKRKIIDVDPDNARAVRLL